MCRAAVSTPGPTAADFDEAFSAAASPGIRRVWELAAPDLPPQLEPVGVDQAAHRAALFGLAGRARFVVGDLTRTGLPRASADAVVCVDAFHFASDPAAAARARRAGSFGLAGGWC
jgi:Methyltransferase domain